jgi:hypothetical protein
MKRLLRQPWLHFALLGGLLFAAERLWFAEAPAPVIVDEAMVQQLRDQWRGETARWPSPVELQASLSRHIDDELLLREALRLGLDGKDAVARQRLLGNLRFALDDAGSDEAALLAEARRLQMPARDMVVRRRLVQVMEQRLISSQLPSESELRDYVAKRTQRYAQPARLTFSQRYFSADGRGADAALAAARAALSQLQARPEAALGDAFLLGGQFSALSAAEIAARFGVPLAQAVAQAPPGAWTGPVLSPYGAHLIRVTEAQPAQSADYAKVRTQAAYAWLAENEPLRLRAALAPLRSRYRVELVAALSAQGLRP